MPRPPPTSTLFPYTTLFRSAFAKAASLVPEPTIDLKLAEFLSGVSKKSATNVAPKKETRATAEITQDLSAGDTSPSGLDRKSTRLNSSHMSISYAVFCLKKK